MVGEIGLQLNQTGADPEYLEQLTVQLSNEISALDVLSVEPDHSGLAPAGTRGVDAATVGALVVSLTPALDALGGLVSTIIHWLRGGDAKRTIRLKIGDDELELMGTDAKTQHRLVEEWIRAHAAH